jgi:tape measure domain-containing protein
MAELKLRVSLDTSYLKGQISRLPLEFAGANVSIRPKFDRQAIVSEFRLLNRYIGGKTFNVVINTNLEAEIKAADRLVAALGRVQQAASGAKGGLPIGTQVLSRTKTKGGFAAAEIKALFGAAVQGGLIDDKTLAATRAQMVAALGSIGKDSIAGLLNGLKSGDADIQAAAQMLGSNLITSFKAVLGIASPSKEFKKLGEAAGQGFEQGLLKSIEIAEQSATRKMQRMLDRLARMALIMSGMSGPEIGRQIAQARGLPSLNFSATTPRASIGIGPSSSGRMLPAAPSRTAIAGTPAPAGLLPPLSSAGRSKAIIEALIASTGPRLLPSGGGDNSLGKLAAPRQTKDAVDAILRNYFKVVEAQVREVFSTPPIKKESLNIFDHLDTEQYFNYLAQARINAENAIKQSIEEARQVTKQNQIKDAAQSFLRALEETVRNAERSVFVQSRIAANQSYVQKANIREIGQPLLGGRQVVAPKMLSAATGFYRGAATPPPLPETQAQLFARREREARMRSVLRGVDVMGETPTRAPARYSYANRPAMPRRPTSAIVPYEAGGALVPSGGGGKPPGGGAYGGPGNFARRGGGPGGDFNMPKLPGAGLVREIGQEFVFATKQVLLFGSAYKALAFLQSFPTQVGAAVGALQSFRNTLNAISPTAADAAASNQLIIDTVDKYNIPIQSARDGFTKLYASMKPAGFSGNQIGDLFLGISKASATLGLSSDKVDRVTYAFSQMASKGQLMSEEVSGQLGDVIPGALSIMAEAANMDIKTFKKAMEDGVFVGKEFEAVMSNVPIVLEKRFGKGAEGAAKTFQGAINNMQTSLTLFYEAFEPVAVGFLNAVVKPISAGLQTLTDGFNAFFTGQAAQTAAGNAFAEQLNNLRPSFEGIRTNLAALIPSLQTFGKLLLSVAQFLASVAGNPITGFLLKVYANVLLVNTAFTLLGGRILLGLIVNINAAIIRFVAFGYAINAVGIQTTGANTALAGTQLQMMLLQRNAGAALAPVNALLGSLARIATIGTIAVVLTVAISNYNQLVDAEARLNRLRGAKANSVVGPQGPQPVQTAQERFRGATRETIEEARGKQTAYLVELALKRKKAEKALQIAQGLANTADADAVSQIESKRPVDIARKNLESIDIDIKNANEVLRLDPRNYPRQGAAGSTVAGAGAGAGTGGKNKESSLESYDSLRDQLAKNFTQAEIDRLEAEHQHKIDLIKSEYDLKEAKANSFQKEALRFERRMAEITLERQGALLKASNAVMAAQGSVAGGATGGFSTTGATGLLQGNTGISGGAHFHISRADGSPISADQARAMLDPSVRRQVTKTSDYGPRRAPVPGASTFHRGVDLAGPANTPLNLAPGYSMVGQGEAGGLGYAASIQGPQGEMYKVGHLQRPAAGAGAPRKVLGSEKRDIVADQKTQLEQVKQSATARQAEAKAIEDAKVALADFVATATPVEEQKLQNDLLKRKTELMMQGYSDSAVEQALKFAEAEYKVNFALKLNEELEKKGGRTKADAAAIAKQMTEGLTAYSSALEENTKRLRDNRLVQAMTTLKDRMSMAGAMTPDQELREQIRQRDPDFLPAEQESLFQQEKLVQSAEKLKADMQGIAGAIGDSFGNAFKGVITGSMTAQEALAGFFQSVADSFADMAAKMIAEYLKMQLIEGIMNIVSMLSPGFGTGIAPGPVAKSAGVKFNPKKMGPAFANGGIAYGGFTAFANGGVVTGPTLGLVGEGRYNEAVIPLPDGKSVPVQLSGGDGGNQMNTNITVNVSNGQAQSNATGSNSSELGRKIEGAVKQVIVGELRPGGLLASR